MVYSGHRVLGWKSWGSPQDPRLRFQTEPSSPTHHPRRRWPTTGARDGRYSSARALRTRLLLTLAPFSPSLPHREIPQDFFADCPADEEQPQDEAEQQPSDEDMATASAILDSIVAAPGLQLTLNDETTTAPVVAAADDTEAPEAQEDEDIVAAVRSPACAGRSAEKRRLSASNSPQPRSCRRNLHLLLRSRLSSLRLHRRP